MGASESKSGRLDCRFAGNNAVVDAATAARDFAVEQGLARGDVSRLCVIIEELVANLYEHGGLAGTDVIDLSLVSAPEGINICCPIRAGPLIRGRQHRTRLRPARGGGAGIDIVRAWTEFVDYVVQPGQNRLELLMPIQSDEIA